jgi:hypothetical protein
VVVVKVLLSRTQVVASTEAKTAKAKPPLHLGLEEASLSTKEVFNSVLTASCLIDSSSNFLQSSGAELQLPSL